MNQNLTISALFCSVLGLCCATCAYGQGTLLDQTLMHDGIERSFLIYQPSSYSDQQDWPLVLNLHGFGSNANEQMPFTGMNEVAEAEGFLVAYPNAINGDWYGPEDNVGFIDAVIDFTEGTHSVNQSKVYVTGMSQGGGLSIDLVMEFPNTYAAAASVAAHSPPGEEFNIESFRPFPLLQIHGTADTLVRYVGGTAFLPGLGEVTFPPVSDFLAEWAENNGADPDPVITELSDVFPDDESTVSLFSFENADTYTGVSGAKIPAELLHYRVNGGGHSWPVDPPFRLSPTAPDFLFPQNSDIHASAVIWDFFSGHELAVVDNVWLPGDYNNDGVVDAADYTVWRDHLGAPSGTLPNDTGGGVIGPAQYDTWKANFGMTTAAFSVNDSAVPEPSSLLVVVGMSLIAPRSLRSVRGANLDVRGTFAERTATITPSSRSEQRQSRRSVPGNSIERT